MNIDHDHTHKHAHEHAHSHEHPHEHEHTHGHCHGHSHKQGKILTVRASSGLSGDMMLSGLAAVAGLDSAALRDLVAELKLPELDGCLRLEDREVNAISGTGCAITLPHEHAHRNLADIEAIIAASDLPAETRELSLKAFRILAEAEAAVHGKQMAEVTFHEVGALDSILDICLVCRLYGLLAPDLFVCSPLPLADGVIHCAHGALPSPAPAVLRMLAGIPVRAFSGAGETVTPTALALLKALDADFGPWPSMRVERTVISFGSKVFADAPNGAIWAIGSR